MKFLNTTIISSCIAVANFAFLGQAVAVGAGIEFEFDEDPIARSNIVSADSLDLTYHACTLVDNGVMAEQGYYWNSSFQDEDSMVDSQINHYLPNGYHIYAKYNFDAVQRGSAQNTITGDRINYEVLDGAIEMWIDPLSDTTIQISDNCEITIANNSDDHFFGGSSVVAQGEKSEADGLAQGDFKIVFGDWIWGQAAIPLITPVETSGIALYDLHYLVFNANITDLNGMLGYNHYPEGSGNVFWLKEFDPLPLSTE